MRPLSPLSREPMPLGTVRTAWAPGHRSIRVPPARRRSGPADRRHQACRRHAPRSPRPSGLPGHPPGRPLAFRSSGKGDQRRRSESWRADGGDRMLARRAVRGSALPRQILWIARTWARAAVRWLLSPPWGLRGGRPDARLVRRGGSRERRHALYPGAPDLARLHARAR